MADPHDPRDGWLTVGQRIGLVETQIGGLHNRVDAIETWRDELRGAMALVRFTLGTSIVTSLVSVISILLVISEHSR